MSIIEIGGLVKEIGNAVDKIFTSDDERLSKEVAKERLRTLIDTKQISLNETESKSHNIFVAGWRPAIGWICAVALFYEYLLVPILIDFGLKLNSINMDELYTVLFGILGLGAFRTIEKIRKK